PTGPGRVYAGSGGSAGADSCRRPPSPTPLRAADPPVLPVPLQSPDPVLALRVLLPTEPDVGAHAVQVVQYALRSRAVLTHPFHRRLVRLERQPTLPARRPAHTSATGTPAPATGPEVVAQGVAAHP